MPGILEFSYGYDNTGHPGTPRALTDTDRAVAWRVEPVAPKPIHG